MNSEIERRASELLRFTKAHNRHRDSITKVTGEHFNIFRVLAVGHLEVRTHSPILADLLNPKGSHGQGEVFLDLFLDHFKIEGFNTKTATAISELYIGPVTEISGGRIDIVIQEAEAGGKTRRILIENKIYAADQENQLIRYRNFDKEAPLLYLTLSGDEPTNVSTEKLKEINYQCISYSKDIRFWLLLCRKEAACLPGVREVISQYITLIEELTHQSTSIQMNAELINEITTDQDSLKAFHTLCDAAWSVKAILLDKLDIQLNKVADKIGVERGGKLEDLHVKWAEFGFLMPCLTDNNLYICFRFESSDFRDLNYGFATIKSDIVCHFEHQLRDRLSTACELYSSSIYWPAGAAFQSPYNNWGHQAFQGIVSGELSGLIKQKVEIMAQIARDIFEKVEE